MWRVWQRAAMDRLFYSVANLTSYCGPTGRVVVFCFCRAAGIFLSRLVEVSGGQDLSRVVIVSLPFPDNISRAGGRDEIEKYARENHGLLVSALCFVLCALCSVCSVLCALCT